MSIPEVIELFDSGTGSLTRSEDGTIARELTLRWLLKDLESYAAAEARLRTQAPDVWAGHYRERMDLQPLGNKWWLGTASYASPSVGGDDEDPGQSDNLLPASVAFDTTGGQEHITQARPFLDFTLPDGGVYGERRFAKTGVTAPSYKGAINVSGDQVNGVDAVVPVFNFTETWTVPVQYLTDTYVSTLYLLTGTVNKDQFRIFKPGECLFMGARCEFARGDFKAPITFSFAARPNEAKKTIGDIDVTNKKGWQYLWIEYESSVDNANLIKRPKFVYIDDIYGEENFVQLGIGSKFPGLYKPRPTGPAIPGK